MTEASTTIDFSLDGERRTKVEEVLTRASGNQLMDTSYGIERDEKLAASAGEKLEKMRETSWTHS